MNKTVKTFTMIILCIMFFYTSPIQPAFAHDNAGIGVSPTITEDYKNTRETGTPGKEWNIQTKGKYVYEGAGGTLALYTNYYFTGKTSYFTLTRNTGSNPIIVEAYTTGKKVLKRITIPANHMASMTINGMKTNEKLYLGFHNQNGYWYSFAGHIR
ncbi:hypothetical protein DSM100688_1509 [Bifidobacterium ramosum]|uniref:Uncharacterized protein n=1 Tax=Bifidobacterium ramosum TaxID=1798158 RepID=A0A6L4WZ67_9BIFI|nr:hypothetical protein [Bifidobacterium ramosum]KAB8287422.1 hypothetical protein DSM100688_1509 [Bifidobacterium ramosum]NEG72142.1 hypothetical protein [Bifidobacterium ramosum]